MNDVAPKDATVSKRDERPLPYPPPGGWPAGARAEQSSRTLHEAAQESTAAHPPQQPLPKPKRPYGLLAAMLIGSALAFPVAAIGFLILLVLAGEHVVTVTEGHDVVIAAALVAGAAVVTTAIVWAKKSRDLSIRARLIGWLLVVVVAVPAVVGSVYFLRIGSPRNLARPAVTGHAEVGSVLTADPGRWSSDGGRLSFDYQWLACRRPSSCAEIGGATNRTYIPRRRDLHRQIRVRVSAFSSGGDYSSDWVRSQTTAAIRPSDER